MLVWPDGAAFVEECIIIHYKLCIGEGTKVIFVDGWLYSTRDTLCGISLWEPLTLSFLDMHSLFRGDLFLVQVRLLMTIYIAFIHFDRFV